MTNPASISPDGDTAPPTVLVVADEPTIRDLVFALLQNEGYTVRQARDGLEALREVEEDGIDLVLSDVRMPRLDCVSLARRLCAQKQTRCPRRRVEQTAWLFLYV